jgi:hypothetical protein
MNAILDFTRDFVRESLETVNFKNLAWAGVFWLVMIATVVGSITLLDEYYTDPAAGRPVRPDDLIFDLLPQMDAFLGISEVAGWFLAGLSFYTIARRRFKEAPTLLFQVAMLFWLRAFTIVLTPLAEINPPNFDHLAARYLYRGMFFSGHTGSAFTQYFFFARRDDVDGNVKILQLLLASLIGFSMVASHAHYTIDVFAAPFIAYFITHYDFGRWIPNSWRGWRWAPWYGGEQDKPAGAL